MLPSKNALIALLASLGLLTGCAELKEKLAPASSKPVFLYSNYYNADGENRYPADGNFSELMALLAEDFEVRVHREPLTDETLGDVDVVLIANPNKDAVEGNIPPPHVSAGDIATITRYVNKGGGLITTHNQENHNLENEQFNRLLSIFGIQIVEKHTAAKAFEIPEEAPIIGGLLWAYIIGNAIEIDPNHPTEPFAIVTNDRLQRPLKDEPDDAGILLAGAEWGDGRVLTIADSGWMLNEALNGEEVAEVVIENADNREIARRLAKWAAGLIDR